nr:carotenoid isomerooxygenase-like [Maniola hyperantus]
MHFATGLCLADPDRPWMLQQAPAGHVPRGEWWCLCGLAEEDLHHVCGQCALYDDLRCALLDGIVREEEGPVYYQDLVASRQSSPLQCLSDNAGVSVFPFGDEVYALTEVTNVYKIDPETLESLEKENLFDALIVCHTAHPHVLPNGDVYNVGINIVRGMMKHVIVKFPYNEKGGMFKMAEIVNTIEPRWRLNPSYMHSFGVTENYFVLIEQPMSISLLTILKNHFFKNSFSNCLNWYPEHETQIVLVDRNTGEETRYRTETFFFLHTINTFEKDSNLIVDVVSYKDAKMIDAMYVEAIKDLHNNPDYGQWCQSRPKRITIPLDAPRDTRVEIKLIAEVGLEVPRIHYDLHNGRPYKYFYGIGSEVHSKYAGSVSSFSNQ